MKQRHFLNYITPLGHKSSLYTDDASGFLCMFGGQ